MGQVVSIGEPPTKVTQSFRRVGEWQLHLVRDRITFRCVLCGKQRVQAIWAATRQDTSRELACQPCYRKLLREHYSKATKARQSITKPSKKELAREKLRRRLLGVDDVVSFFRAAGIAAELLPDGRLRVNGQESRPLPQILPPLGAFDWSEVIDETAIRYASDKFIRAMSHNGHFGRGRRAVLRPGDMGFAIMRQDIRLGLIRATHAYVPGHDAIVANFLSPGSHWQAVADLIHDAEPALIAEHDREHLPGVASSASGNSLRPAPQHAVRYIRELPDSVPAGLRASCIEASRRLRLERQVAYDRPVLLTFSIGELTLLPVAENHRGFSIPFHFASGDGAIEARLVLASSDPLPLEIRENVSISDAVTAWTHALIGFADVTCIHLDHATRKRTETRLATPSPDPGSRHPLRTAPGRHHPWPSHLEPIGRWTNYSGSLVAGHRRHLTAGQTASEEAHLRARQVGITLSTNETWVRSHTRGIPGTLQIRFKWHRPDELRFQLPTRAGSVDHLEQAVSK